MALIAEEMKDIEQGKRAARAHDEDFLFTRFPTHVSCLPMSSDNEYIIKDGRCSCPDYQYRCASVGLECKHLIALRMAIQRGEINR